ncbi:MAG: WD40 repeat domain-containing protein, partial [Thermoguttaceae bacterium]|nr:WD40 repeat domain-containing protein [Thermoguttaceae bacterium]
GVLLATGEFAKPLPQRKTAVDSFKTAATDVSNAASGFAWSRDDSLLCVAFGNGRAVLAETLNFTPLETFVVNDSSSGLAGRLYASPFFTRDGKLVTLDTRGYLKRWDFRPSPEKPTVLDARRGANLLTGTARPNIWASLRFSMLQNYPFVLKDGDQELYRRPAVAWFDRLTEPGASRETFLILGLDGVLSAVDETGAAVETGVDWNLGAPSVPNRNDALAEQDRLMLELIQKYPNGDYPPEELEALAKKIDALTSETPTDGIATGNEGEDEIAFEEDADENAEKIGGFVRVAVAPNRRAFAAIGRGDGALYVLTTAEAAQGWRLVATPEDFDDPFVKLAFRPDSLELAAIREDGVVTFVPFDAASDGVVWSQKTFEASEKGLLNNAKSGAFAYTPSGRFLLQTGIGSSVWIWNVETRELAQVLELDLYERTQLDALDVSGLAPLRLNDDATPDDAFVVASSDGVLRFYRYNDATQTFAPVYIVSPTTLSEMIDDGELESVVKDRLFKRETRVVQCLTVSDDGKKLYVGSVGDVYSFDLDEIRRNVATLPEYWRDLDVESATGLRYSPLDGFRSVERDRLLPVEPKP